MSDCLPGCLIAAPIFDYGGCGLEDAIRSGFIKNFVALRCDETIPDITDDTAISAQVSAGTLFSSPTLTGELPFPATGGEITENCQPPQPTERTYAFNFTTYRVDNDNLTDFTTWNDLQGSLTTWYIAPVTCDNVMLVPQNFSSGGILFSMRGTISNVVDNTNAMSYQGQLSFKYNQLLNGVQLTTAVSNALGISGTGETIT